MALIIAIALTGAAAETNMIFTDWISPNFGRPGCEAAASAVLSAILADRYLDSAGLRVSISGNTLFIDGAAADCDAIERAIAIATSITSARVVSRAIPTRESFVIDGLGLRCA